MREEEGCPQILVRVTVPADSSPIVASSSVRCKYSVGESAVTAENSAISSIVTSIDAKTMAVAPPFWAHTYTRCQFTDPEKDNANLQEADMQVVPVATFVQPNFFDEVSPAVTSLAVDSALHLNALTVEDLNLFSACSTHIRRLIMDSQNFISRSMDLKHLYRLWQKSERTPAESGQLCTMESQAR